jgi:hypothetical protein
MVHLRKTWLYAKVRFKTFFKNKSLSIEEHTVLIHTGSSLKPLPDSPSAVAHGTTAGYFPNNSH